MIQQVLEAQVTDHLGADRYERSDERGGYRNGNRERQLYTRVGPLTLRVPQTRDGSFPATYSLLRLIALLAEISESWQKKIYFDMGDYHEWVVERRTAKKEGTKAA